MRIRRQVERFREVRMGMWGVDEGVLRGRRRVWRLRDWRRVRISWRMQAVRKDVR